MKPIEILLVGTGAVGSYFGGKLAQTEVRVSALCRSDFDIVRNKGIQIQSYKGDFEFHPAEIVRSARELSVKPDFILVCLKVLPQVNVAEIIKDAVGPETAIVLIQNGIEIEREVDAAFPENEIISGIAFIAVSRLELGVARHTGSGKLTFGSYPQGISEKTQQLSELFDKAEVPCDLSEKITKNRWQKMLWNAAFNPLSVLGGRANSKQMVDVPESEVLVRKVMGEILQLAAATGNKLDESTVNSSIEANRKMRPFKTSMLVDFENDRSMEVDAILGNAIRVAQETNVAVPYLETLYSLLKLQTHVLETAEKAD